MNIGEGGVESQNMKRKLKVEEASVVWAYKNSMWKQMDYHTIWYDEVNKGMRKRLRE